MRIITHALTQRRCFSSLFNLMITSGSNTVTYFYLFFFRAKNVGCEVRRCVRQRREKIMTINRTGNYEDLCILFRGCANHSGFVPEKARGPMQSWAKLFFLLFFWNNAAALLLCVAFQNEDACAHRCAFQSSFSYLSKHTLDDCNKRWLQVGPGSSHQFLFWCSSLHSTLRHLKIDKGNNLA